MSCQSVNQVKARALQQLSSECYSPHVQNSRSYLAYITVTATAGGLLYLQVCSTHHLSCSRSEQATVKQRPWILCIGMITQNELHNGLPKAEGCAATDKGLSWQFGREQWPTLSRADTQTHLALTWLLKDNLLPAAPAIHISLDSAAEPQLTGPWHDGELFLIGAGVCRSFTLNSRHYSGAQLLAIAHQLAAACVT